MRSTSRFYWQLIYRCTQTGIMGLVHVPIFALTALQFPSVYLLQFGFLVGFLLGFFEFYVVRTIKVRFTITYLIILAAGYLFILSISIPIVNSEIYSSFTFIQKLQDVETKRALIYGALMISSLRIYIRVESLIGIRTFPKLLIGKYMRPQKEERFFMFIDLNASTSIAEELGDQMYYEFLNSFFRDLSLPVFQTGAEIHKYIGDEVILTWPVKKGKQDNNVINLYFMFRKNIIFNRAFYMQRFGQVPRFKASLHFGEVISARVGDLKKELAYNGDVLNTTARIISQCKKLKRSFLVSESAFFAINDTSDHQYTYIPNVQLEGKEQRINLYAVA